MYLGVFRIVIKNNIIIDLSIKILFGKWFQVFCLLCFHLLFYYYYFFFSLHNRSPPMDQHNQSTQPINTQSTQMDQHNRSKTQQIHAPRQTFFTLKKRKTFSALLAFFDILSIFAHMLISSLSLFFLFPFFPFFCKYSHSF